MGFLIGLAVGIPLGFYLKWKRYPPVDDCNMGYIIFYLGSFGRRERCMHERNERNYPMTEHSSSVKSNS